MWKLEFDENFFRIHDSKKMVAGYFDPDYGNVFSGDNSEEIIESMIKNHDTVLGGIIMVPLVKFKLFDTDLDTSLANVGEQVTRVSVHLQKWRNFMFKGGHQAHSVRISHTDQDMLTITFPIAFSKPTPLDKNTLIEEIGPIFDALKNFDLL